FDRIGNITCERIDSHESKVEESEKDCLVELVGHQREHAGGHHEPGIGEDLFGGDGIPPKTRLDFRIDAMTYEHWDEAACKRPVDHPPEVVGEIAVNDRN